MFSLVIIRLWTEDLLATSLTRWGDVSISPSCELVSLGVEFSRVMTDLAFILGRWSSGWRLMWNLSLDLRGWTLSLYISLTFFLLLPCNSQPAFPLLPPSVQIIFCTHNNQEPRTMAQQQQIRYAAALSIRTRQQTLQRDAVCRLLKEQNRNEAFFDYLTALM